MTAPQGSTSATRAPAPDEAARVRLGAHPATPPETLRALAADGSAMVRATVAMNPATPPEVDHALARDGDERVRVLLARKLGSLLPALQGDATLRDHAVGALLKLAEDAALRVRAALAEELKELADAPHALILRLAQDAEVMVSTPILRFSPQLTTQDLLALLAERPSAAAEAAIAGRAAIAPEVCDAIATRAGADAIRVLLCNQSAQIREATLDGLIARAVDHVPWHAPLVQRPHLPPRAALALSEIVATQLLETLAARADLDVTMATELQARLARRLARHGAPGDGPGGGTVADRSGDAPPHAADGDRAGGNGGGPAEVPACNPVRQSPEKVEQAPSTVVSGLRGGTPAAQQTTRSSGDSPGPAAAPDGLSETALLAAIQRGDRTAVATMLATAAAVPAAVVHRAATLRSGKALVSLAWRAGFSGQAAIGLQLLLGRLAPADVLRPLKGGGFPLTPEEMRWQLDFLAAPARP
ncbi:MAG: hypothetical protein BGO51_19140 [Rhodospirillales bacterium 69-11]|nr:DUF2336 domain-containing protein [Rhodospirillales bacterium]OJW28597.1 MAG: hypothetical protein BGO51_19140 [Rhodospirillales bacterium 69-11]